MSTKILYVDKRPAACPICCCAITGSPWSTTIFCNMCGTKIVVGDKDEAGEVPGDDRAQLDEELDLTDSKYSYNNNSFNNGMKMMILECPKCHASLEETSNMGTFYCKYCGQKIVVGEMQDAAVQIKQREIELQHETKRIEAIQQIRLYEKKIKRLEQQKAARNTMTIALIFVALGIAVMMSFMIPQAVKHKKLVDNLRSVESEVQTVIAAGDYEYALIKVNELRLDDGYSTTETEAWDAKREDYINTIKTLMEHKGIEPAAEPGRDGSDKYDYILE